MNLAPHQLGEHLKRGIKSLYTLHGDEPLLVHEFADSLRAHARGQGYTERTVHTAQGAHFDWSVVLASGGSLSLFADKQIVEIRIPSGKPGKEGSEALQRYCQRLPEDVLTLVTLPKLDFQQSKAAWFGALDAAGLTVRVETLARHALPAWLAQRLVRQQQQVAAGEEGQRTLAFFADRIEGNLLAAHQELQKLALLHPAGVLRFEQVESAVLNVARYDTAKLAEAVWTGQTARALRVLDGLQAEGEPAVMVHWTMAEDIRALARAHAALEAGKPVPLALKDARVWGVKEKLFERVLPLLASHQMAHLLDAASIVDGIVKGLKHPDWPHEPWPALKRWMLSMLQVSTSQGRSQVRLALRA